MAEANRSDARKATWHFAGAVSSAGGQAPTFDLPEFAFAGRSNVGKSTLINRLVRSPGLARTRPGRFSCSLPGASIGFAELACYGLDRVPVAILATFRPLV